MSQKTEETARNIRESTEKIENCDLFRIKIAYNSKPKASSSCHLLTGKIATFDLEIINISSETERQRQ